MSPMSSSQWQYSPCHHSCWWAQSWTCTWSCSPSLPSLSASYVAICWCSLPVEHSSTSTTVTANRETVWPLAPAWVWEIGEVHNWGTEGEVDWGWNESTDQNERPFWSSRNMQECNRDCPLLVVIIMHAFHRINCLSAVHTSTHNGLLCLGVHYIL